MSAKLRVRLYDVLFGDAILVSVPDRDDDGPRMRHILIDVGNRPNQTGSDDAVFEPAWKNILEELKGEPLDLYVMTHEHMDHVQGLLVLSKLGHDVAAELRPRHVWLTASAAPDYYDKHPEAKKQKKKMEKAYSLAAARLQAAGVDTLPRVQTLLALNNPGRTADCVAFLRGLAPASRTHYVHRQSDLAGKHDFRVAKPRIWAPEEDTSIYYGRFKPLGLEGDEGSAAAERAAPESRPVPPRGVDAGAFYGLVDSRERGWVETLLRIDKAANDTSLVFSLEWKGWKLLFTGDAEERSWKEMNKRGVVEPVHFLKVSHHLSHNGTPQGAILDRLFPIPKPDKKKRYAGVSTCEDAYSGIPHEETRADLAARATIRSTHELKNGKGWVDFIFG